METSPSPSSFSSPLHQLLDLIIPSFSGFIFRTRTHILISGTCFAQPTPSFSERYRLAVAQDSSSFSSSFSSSSSSSQPPLLALCHSKPLRFPISSLAPFLQPLLTTPSPTIDSFSLSKEEIFWEGITQLLQKTNKMTVCFRCGNEAKNQMLSGFPPSLPFVFPTSHYLCHSLVLHGEILVEDSEYICRPSGNCCCKGCVSTRKPSPSSQQNNYFSSSFSPSSPSSSILPFSPSKSPQRSIVTFSPSKSPQQSVVSFSPRKRKRNIFDPNNNNYNNNNNNNNTTTTTNNINTTNNTSISSLPWKRPRGDIGW